MTDEPDQKYGAKAAPPKPLRWRTFAIIGGVLLAILLLALLLSVPPHFVARTDDAYVEADVVTVAPKVPGYVSSLNITDNTRFAAGAELLRIDDRDYLIAVRNAAAALRAAIGNRATVLAQSGQQRHAIDAARATLLGDRGNVTFAEQQVNRYAGLARGGYGSFEHLQATQADRTQRVSTLTHDEADYRSATAQLSVLQGQIAQADAQIGQARAQLAQARLNLSYTRIGATFDGTVANRIVRAGNYVQPGQALFSEVPDRVYIIANYKELQLAHMRLGQPVTVYVDAFSGEPVHGHVDSFQRGTGSTFALLPPENATGNFVKVVQRVPVKIVLDGPASRFRTLVPGMSVETQVGIRTVPWILRPFL